MAILLIPSALLLLVLLPFAIEPGLGMHEPDVPLPENWGDDEYPEDYEPGTDWDFDPEED